MLFSDEEMEVLKRLHNLHKKTLTVGGRAGIHILKVHLTPSRGVATKHKRPHCCQNCASVVRQCKCFKDLIFEHCMYAVYPQMKLQDVLGRSEHCGPLCAGSNYKLSPKFWKQVFPRHTRSQYSRASLSLLSSLDIYQEIIKFQI